MNYFRFEQIPRRVFLKSTATAFALLLTGPGATLDAIAGEVELRAAGSTFVAPLMSAWINGFDKARPNVALRYDAVGSGEGVERLLTGAVDFAASDAYLAPAEAARVARGLVQVPSTAGMIVLAYNLPGVKGQIRLPRDVYVDIFLGKIQMWDDPRIRAANPDVKLPAKTIAVVSRQEASGTTYAFTDHLAAVSKNWAAGPGVGKTVEWPRATMRARGNEGVASRIRISEGAIGYVEYGFALRLNLAMATLENKDGQFIEPTPQSGAAALASTADTPLATLDASTANPGGAKSYPIVTYSWILLYRDYPAEKSRAINAFVTYALDEGQSYAPYFGYLPLPAKIADQGKAALTRLNGGVADSAAASSGRTAPTPH
jgi:phosphate transport system substrate-binding protein